MRSKALPVANAAEPIEFSPVSNQANHGAQFTPARDSRNRRVPGHRMDQIVRNQAIGRAKMVANEGGPIFLQPPVAADARRWHKNLVACVNV